MDSSTMMPPSILQLLQIPINCEFALATLGLYDWTLTLEREIQLIWKRRFNWISVLFCVNRYLPPITSALIFWKNLSTITSGRACTAMVLGQMIVDILMGVCAAIFYAIQAFALFDRQKILLLLALGLGLATPIISLCVWSIAASHSLDVNGIGEHCSSLAALVTGAYDNWLVASRVASLCANFLILSLIVIKSRIVVKHADGLSLPQILTEQAIALPNFIAIALAKIPVLEANIPLHNELTTSLLISRFILTLRAQQVGHDESDGDVSEKSAAVPVFRTGSLARLESAGLTVTPRQERTMEVYSVM
ncbi:hypothetical protein BDW22DRAFT_1352098 [Trametopsis cervina]|nr:hypothetical protein BDW22DRAFT_1352098 [Trametopsis cervina]